MICKKKKKKKIDKNILVSELIASKMAAVNCLYYEGNTCHVSQCLKKQF